MAMAINTYYQVAYCHYKVKVLQDATRVLHFLPLTLGRSCPKPQVACPLILLLSLLGFCLFPHTNAGIHGLCGMAPLLTKT